MVLKILIAAAGLMGAAGVALWSAAAHIASGANLDTAAHMLLFHAAATVATAAAMHSGLLRLGLAQFAAQGFVIGGSLFAADLAFRAFYGTPFLFRMAAPTGGGIVIASWILLTLSALFPPKNSR
jgi:uncharacterized membrane protein YgdD (TMEM256/DUF423 family)